MRSATIQNAKTATRIIAVEKCLRGGPSRARRAVSQSAKCPRAAHAGDALKAKRHHLPVPGIILDQPDAGRTGRLVVGHGGWDPHLRDPMIDRRIVRNKRVIILFFLSRRASSSDASSSFGYASSTTSNMRRAGAAKRASIRQENRQKRLPVCTVVRTHPSCA